MANDFDLQIKNISGSQIEVQATDANSISGTEKVLIQTALGTQETTTQDIADLGGGGLGYATITLNDDQIKALPTTPVEIVAAQGDGKGIMPISCMLLSDFSAGAYSGSGSNTFDIQLTWGNNVVNATIDIEMDMTHTTPEFNQLFPGSPNNGYNSGSISQMNNANITLSSDNGSDLTGGNAANTLTVVFYYTIINV